MRADPLGLDATVCVYQGAGGFGHVGIGVNTKTYTLGFYPQSDARGNPLTGTSGVIKLDKKEPVGCKTIETTPDQDKKMESFIQNTALSGNQEYQFTGTNCVNFVRSALKEAGVSSSQSIAPYPYFNAIPGKEWKP